MEEATWGGGGGFPAALSVGKSEKIPTCVRPLFEQKQSAMRGLENRGLFQRCVNLDAKRRLGLRVLARKG